MDQRASRHELAREEMPDLKLMTDMGDWSTLPRRIRLAFVSFLVGASVVGLAAGIGVNPRWRSTLSL